MTIQKAITTIAMAMVMAMVMGMDMDMDTVKVKVMAMVLHMVKVMALIMAPIMAPTWRCLLSERIWPVVSRDIAKCPVSVQWIWATNCHYWPKCSISRETARLQGQFGLIFVYPIKGYGFCCRSLNLPSRRPFTSHSPHPKWEISLQPNGRFQILYCFYVVLNSFFEYK